MKSESMAIETKNELFKFFDPEKDLKDYIAREDESLVGKDLWEYFLSVLVEKYYISESIPLQKSIKDLERKIIIKTLSRVNGNLKEASRLLGMKYTTLHEKLKKFNIRVMKRAY